MPARRAASPGPRSLAPFPNQPWAAASTPMKFDPNGARLRYCESIQHLSRARSIFMARMDSIHFSRRFLR